ncbi:MAG: hypothetical protein ACR2P5_07785 [Gammaproteobacteria bacterium]
MSGWEAAVVIVALLMLAEGAACCGLSEESWKKLRDYIGGLSVGQVHTVGALMMAAGAILLMFALV